MRWVERLLDSPLRRFAGVHLLRDPLHYLGFVNLSEPQWTSLNPLYLPYKEGVTGLNPASPTCLAIGCQLSAVGKRKPVAEC